MKNSLLVLFVTLALFSCKSDKEMEYLIFPDYNIVVNKFFSEYSVKDLTNYDQITFAKEPTGWHVLITNYSAVPVITKDEVFWDRKNKVFNKINFPSLVNQLENQKQLSVFLNDWKIVYYRICPYYGYDNWDWDVIENYKDNDNLPDSILYGLGQAYASYSTNLLDNKNGLINNTVCFNLPEGKNSMTNIQLEKYRKYTICSI
jgi:hypothetical protein